MFSGTHFLLQSDHGTVSRDGLLKKQDIWLVNFILFRSALINRNPFQSYFNKKFIPSGLQNHILNLSLYDRPKLDTRLCGPKGMDFFCWSQISVHVWDTIYHVTSLSFRSIRKYYPQPMLSNTNWFNDQNFCYSMPSSNFKFYRFTHQFLIQTINKFLVPAICSISTLKVVRIRKLPIY